MRNTSCPKVLRYAVAFACLAVLPRNAATQQNGSTSAAAQNPYAKGQAVSQSASTDGETHPFQRFFAELAATKGAEGRRGETSYIKLMESIATLPVSQVSEGIAVIDSQLDSTIQPEDPLAKFDAAMLLVFISSRADGADIMASQMDRLTSMLNNPSHSLSSPAALALQYLAVSQPQTAISALRKALEAPDVNNSTSIGPGIATLLLRIDQPSADVTQSVVQYMRRPDLTEKQLIDTIIGIDSSPIIPDSVSLELVRCLDRQNESVKGRALVGIARSSPSAKVAAQIRLQRMANDPAETPHARHLATEALAGRITENPDAVH